MFLFVIWFAEDQSVTALPAIVPVLHGCHEDASSALFRRAFPPQPADLAIFIHLKKVTQSMLSIKNRHSKYISVHQITLDRRVLLPNDIAK